MGSLLREGVPHAQTALTVVYLGNNIAMNLLNRWMLGLIPFPFPYFMTACQMLFQFAAFAPYMLRSRQQRAEHWAAFGAQSWGLACIAATFALNVRPQMRAAALAPTPITGRAG